MRCSVFLFVSALTLWSVDLTAAPTHGLCATNFKAVARLRRSPDYKNNHQLLIWMYDEAGLQKASNRMRTKIEQTLSRGHVAAEPSKVKVDRGGLMNALNFGDGIKALWKLKTSGTIRDVTTYRFDRFLGANVVPISTELSYEGKQIVVQLYVPGTDGEALKTNPHHLSLFD